MRYMVHDTHPISLRLTPEDRASLDKLIAYHRSASGLSLGITDVVRALIRKAADSLPKK